MKDEQQEVREAIIAANNALSHLNAAKECLHSASNWGLADLIGGGFAFSLVKHSRMNSAKQELASAKSTLPLFAKELQAVHETSFPDIEINDILSFADLFCDGVIADWLMQQRIKDTSAQVSDAIARVTRMRAQLERLPH